MTWQQLNPLISWPEEKLLGARKEGTGKEKRIQLIKTANIQCALYMCHMFHIHEPPCISPLTPLETPMRHTSASHHLPGYKVGQRSSNSP